MSATLRIQTPTYNLKSLPAVLLSPKLWNCKTSQTPVIIPTLAPTTIQANVLAPSSANYYISKHQSRSDAIPKLQKGQRWPVISLFGLKIPYFGYPNKLPLCVRLLHCGYPAIYHISVGDLFSSCPPYQLSFWDTITNVNIRLLHVWLHSLPIVTFEQKPAPVAYPAADPLPLPAAR